jgi:hypothetical protein
VDPTKITPVNSLSNKKEDNRRRRVLESEYDTSLNPHMLPKNKPGMFWIYFFEIIMFRK